MFAFRSANAYDPIVEKATSENLTSEQWDTNLTICDQVNLEGDEGARQVTASIQKRLLHRSASVQLYALTLTDALVSNCKSPLHREVASSAFTESMKRLATDRVCSQFVEVSIDEQNSHLTVKKRAAFLVKKWAEEFANDERLGIMQDAYQQLKMKGVTFDGDDKPAARPNQEHDENALARLEEENIQRAIRESEAEAERIRQSKQPKVQPNGHGYVPAASTSKPLPEPAKENPAPAPAPQRAPPQQLQTPPIQRAKALYDFEPDPNQPGELPLRKGDIIRILDRAYAEWWRGECRNRVGIFPVNWVQVLPEPTPEELWAEAQMEANVFAQVGNVDRLLGLLRAVEERGDTARIGDDDEITELYQQCLSLRPKVLKLIDKYTQKKVEFLDINSKFVEAKRTYEGMLDETWSRHQDMRGPSMQTPPLAYGQPAQHQQPMYPNQQPQVYQQQQPQFDPRIAQNTQQPMYSQQHPYAQDHQPQSYLQDQQSQAIQQSSASGHPPRVESFSQHSQPDIPGAYPQQQPQQFVQTHGHEQQQPPAVNVQAPSPTDSFQQPPYNVQPQYQQQMPPHAHPQSPPPQSIHEQQQINASMSGMSIHEQYAGQPSQPDQVYQQPYQQPHPGFAQSPPPQQHYSQSQQIL